MSTSNEESVLVTEFVTSLAKATEIMRRLRTKAHRACGFYYVLNDLGLMYASRSKVVRDGLQCWANEVLPNDKNGKPLQLQRSYKLGTDLYHLRVYKTRSKDS